MHTLALVFFFAVSSVSQKLSISHPRLSTKTYYNLSVELDKLDGFFDLQNTSKPLQCLKKSSVMHITGVFRHGIRYPGAKDVKNGMNVLKKFKKASLKDELLIRLNDTLNMFPPDDEKNIAPSGIVEHVDLGFQFGTKYKKLFANVEEHNVKFYSTKKQRTVKSFEGFLKGFQNVTNYKFNATSVTRDDLLRFYDFCKKYIDDVDKNKSAFIEATYYLNLEKAKLNKLIEEITNTTNLDIDINELNSLIGLAGCELSTFKTRNWLEILSEDVLDILNYASDVEDYWKKGPGYNISYEQSCILMSEIFKTFDKIIDGKASEKGIFYFSHAETLYPLFGILQIFKDPLPLYHNNSQIQKNRNFKSTRITPFASNIAFVLHKCESNNGEEEIFIELLFKEHPLTWPACMNSICPYKEIRRYFSRYIDHCDFQDMCKEGTSSKTHVEVHPTPPMTP